LGTNPNQIINIDLHGATDLIEGFHDQKNLNKFCSIYAIALPHPDFWQKKQPYLD
jgi:hypothetical protein